MREQCLASRNCQSCEESASSAWNGLCTTLYFSKENRARGQKGALTCRVARLRVQRGHFPLKKFMKHPSPY